MCDCEWMDIETAPKDGTPILISHTDGWVDKARWSDDKGGHWFVMPGFWTEQIPTHWMSLPPAPQEKKQ